MAQQKRWAVSVEFIVETESAEDAVIQAARACRELRTRGVMPGNVTPGQPVGGGDLDHVYEIG